MKPILMMEDSEFRFALMRRLIRGKADLVCVRTVQEMRNAASAPFGLILLDYDLHTRENGEDAAKWIAANKKPLELCPIILHSADDVGANIMASILRDKGFECSVAEFGTEHFCNVITTMIERGAL